MMAATPDEPTSEHPELQQIVAVDTDTGEVQEKRLSHRQDARRSIAHWQPRRYGSAWKAAGMLGGSNDSWPSCSLSYASEPMSVIVTWTCLTRMYLRSNVAREVTSASFRFPETKSAHLKFSTLSDKKPWRLIMFARNISFRLITRRSCEHLQM
jgi:hypothetical protein